MKMPDTLNPVWPDRTAILTLAASAVEIALPTDNDDNDVNRCLLTCGEDIIFAYTLTHGGAVSLADADEGIMFSREQGYMIIETRGYSHINTFASGAGKLHITPLAD